MRYAPNTAEVKSESTFLLVIPQVMLLPLARALLSKLTDTMYDINETEVETIEVTGIICPELSGLSGYVTLFDLIPPDKTEE